MKLPENSFSIDNNGHKKKELWELNKTPYERFKINARVVWRRFDTQTRGMGLIFILLGGMFMLMNIIPIIGQSIQDYLNAPKYKNALTTACTQELFYSLNYKDCENQGVRP